MKRIIKIIGMVYLILACILLVMSFTVKTSSFMRPLPRNLYLSGFTPYGDNNTPKVNTSGLDKIRNFIRSNWKRTPNKLNRMYNSHKLAYHATDRLGIEVHNGELIAAAILEGYRIEQSVSGALFYAEINLNNNNDDFNYKLNNSIRY